MDEYSNKIKLNMIVSNICVIIQIFHKKSQIFLSYNTRDIYCNAFEYNDYN